MRILLVCLGLVLCGIRSNAQITDTTLWSPNGPVNAIALKDSLLFVGGNFDQVAPVTGNFIALDSSNAILATNFPKVNGKINCMIRDTQGFIYVGGLFGKVGNIDCFNLFRLTPQGNVDVNFIPNPNGEVFDLSIGWNTLFIGGDFTIFGGETRLRGAAITLDDDSITPFDPNADGPIYSLCPDVVGFSVIVGGDFTSVGNGVISYLGKLDPINGTYRGWGNSVWTAIPQVFGPVKSISIFHNKLFVAGDFLAFASYNSPGIGLLDLTSGVVQQQYNAQLNGFVKDVEIIGDEIFIAGNFTTSHSLSRMHLACLDTLLNLKAWNPSADGVVYDIAPNEDSTSLYVAGTFHKIGTDTCYNAGKVLLDSLGTVIVWNPKLNNGATSILPANIAGKVWIGGDFSGAGGVLRKNLCSININSKIATNWNPIVDLPVNCLAIDNTNLFIAGSFNTINGLSRSKLASMDISSGSLNAFNPGINGAVRTMVSDNTNLFLGGNFTTLGNQSRNNIGSVNISTGSATLWNPGSAGTVNKIILDNNNVYVAGFFTQCGGQFRDNLARLSKSTGLADWSWVCNTDDGIYDIDLFNDQLYLGGWFLNVSGQSRNYFAAVDTTTGNLLPFNPVIGNYIHGFARWNNDLFIAGAFTVVNGNLIKPYLCNYDLGDGLYDAWSPSPNSFPETMQVSQNQLYVGGNFATIGYKYHPNLAMLNIAWVTDVTENGIFPEPIIIWPNPSTDQIHIDFSEQNNTYLSVEIFDTNGKIVKKVTPVPYSKMLTLEIGNLSAGIYLIQLLDSKGNSRVARFVKQ